jgi:methylthioribose-1-phosphate isomerase
MSELIEHLRWDGEYFVILDQTLLPTRTEFLKLSSIEEVWEAIKVLRVRGAPAIGVAAAFGMYLGLRHTKANSAQELRRAAQEKADYLNSSRPTAVNLRWATERMLRHLDSQLSKTVSEILHSLLAEAQAILDEDNKMCQSIGLHGMSLIHDGARVLTHCNAGGLATGRFGTALAPVYAAHEKGMHVAVYADETRPLLQGARLTAFELQRAGVPVTLICDNMAATVMAQKKVDLVIVGADRITASGDFANKIGTYGVAILAKEHGIPFYCAAPSSTIDLRLSSGNQIPIEERLSEEITHGFGKQTAPSGIQVFNPAFDVTPAKYVTAFITEKGVVRPPFEQNLRSLFS